MTEARAKSDYEIQAAVIKRLDWSGHARPEHIGVAVTDGAVTLCGEAADAREKEAALRAASEVRGVDAVVDEIVVRNAAGMDNDTDIARNVQETIERAQRPRPTVVGLVDEGVVTLTGVVESSDERSLLRDAMAALPGVGSVVDQMSEPPHASSDQVREQAVDALVHTTLEETKSLRVEVIDRVAIIQGVVHSSYDKRAIGLAASQVPGVSHIDDRLVVAS